MNKLLHQLIPILRLSSGQRFLIYNRMAPLAQELGQARLLAHLDLASAHEQVTRELENRWNAATTRVFGDQVAEIDSLVDLTLSGIRDIAVGQAKGLPAHHPVAARVDEFLTEVFPHGVRAITALPYVDQVMAVEVIVGKLNNGLASSARQLGLSDKVEQLTALTAEYRRLVDVGRSDVGFAEVREARDVGHDYMREIVAIVVGTYFDSRNDEHVKARESLLEPLVDQLALQQQKTRARRRGSAGQPAEPVDSVADNSDTIEPTPEVERVSEITEAETTVA